MLPDSAQQNSHNSLRFVAQLPEKLVRSAYATHVLRLDSRAAIEYVKLMPESEMPRMKAWQQAVIAEFAPLTAATLEIVKSLEAITQNPQIENENFAADPITKLQKISGYKELHHAAVIATKTDCPLAGIFVGNNFLRSGNIHDGEALIRLSLNTLERIYAAPNYDSKNNPHEKHRGVLNTFREQYPPRANEEYVLKIRQASTASE